MIQVVNLPAVLAGLGRVQVGLEAGEQTAERAGAQVAARLAQGFAPRRTGQLAASVKAQGDEVVASADYAGYQEYGTSFHPAQAFMEPARRAAEVPFYALAQRIFTVVTR